jgi:hypothetical protein
MAGRFLSRRDLLTASRVLGLAVVFMLGMDLHARNNTTANPGDPEFAVVLFPSMKIHSEHADNRQAEKS